MSPFLLRLHSSSCYPLSLLVFAVSKASTSLVCLLIRWHSEARGKMLPFVIARIIAALGILVSVLAAETVARQRPAFRAVNTTVTTFVRDPNQVLTVPLRRFDHRGVATPSLARRFFKTDLLGVYGAAYLAELTIGAVTNGRTQVVDVLIDTGSFELWVNPVCSSSNMPELCHAFGYYDPALSRTSRKVGDRGFSITYGSGSVSGDFYKDDVYISGVKIEAQQFGVANSSDLVWFGIMGLGHGLGNGFIDHPLVVDSLAAQGLTNTKLFSLDLGGQINPGIGATGEMVFGGVDTNKYAGLLKKVPTEPSDPHYKVTLNSLAHRAPGDWASKSFTDTNFPLPVIVDSGTTLSLLPESIVTKIAAQFPGAKPDGNGGYQVDCAYQGKDGSVDFMFSAATGTVTVSVAYRDFIWNSSGQCFLGAAHNKDLGVWILGDTFLRGAYVAFDQTNNALFMANYVACGGGRSKLVAVPPGPNAAGNIPGSCPERAIPSPPWPSSSYPYPSESATTTSHMYPDPEPYHVDPQEPTPSPPPYPSPGSVTGGSVHTSTKKGSNPTPASTICSDSSMTVVGITKTPSVSKTTMTITRTLVRTSKPSSTVCSDSEPNCQQQGQVTTQLETVTTTFSPGHSDDDVITIFTAGPNTPTHTAIVHVEVVTPEKGEVHEVLTHTTAQPIPSEDTTETRIITIAPTGGLHPSTFRSTTAPLQATSFPHAAAVPIAGAERMSYRPCPGVLLAICGILAFL
ncbi:aspartic peptidase domain-containing protein [Xylaria nigripes]|nr:aspartic peptidase domain-containing protein [Xylaria nigripes]